MVFPVVEVLPSPRSEILPMHKQGDQPFNVRSR
jgi:hypothetical protein